MDGPRKSRCRYPTNTRGRCRSERNSLAPQKHRFPTLSLKIRYDSLAPRHGFELISADGAISHRY
jgi:hypothetical protein